jgi:hypothetical protein
MLITASSWRRFTIRLRTSAVCFMVCSAPVTQPAVPVSGFAWQDPVGA